jgi:hypothetical protein
LKTGEVYALSLYQETDIGGDESYMIDISPGCNRVRQARDMPGARPHVQVRDRNI